MRIAIVTHKVDFHDGQGRVNYEIVQAALAQGHSVTVIGERCAAEIVSHPRGRFVRLDWARLPTQLLRNLYLAYTSARWLKQHREEFDIVQANGFVTWAPADVVAVHFVHSAWANNAHYPFHWSSFSPYQWYQRLFTLLSSYFERRAFRQARALVAVSHFTAKEVAELGFEKGRITVVNNGVDVGEFAPGSTEREAFGLPADVPLALFVGDIRTARKNLETVLRAMELVPVVHLAVAGKLKGSPYPALAASLKLTERVHFLGTTSRIADLMRSCDFFVFPSRYEAQPLVLLEALASGLPVIVSGNFGAGDYIQEAGLLFADPNDFEAMAALIRELAANPARRQKMSEAARREALGMQWGRTALGYLAVYEKVLEEKAAGQA